MKNRIRIERAVMQISQEKLSEMVQVSRQTIHAIENGKYIPSTLLALKIAKVFNKQVEEVFELEESDWDKTA
jgi:putative transcriptional regulator